MATVRRAIEVDITCVNRSWFTLKKKRNIPPQYVIGIFQRDGKAIIKVLEDNSQEAIKQAILKSVAPGCLVYSEEKILHDSLREVYEINELKEGSRVSGDIHVNNVKNMWKDLKRNIKQTHIHVSGKYLQLYCDEVAWKVNNRHLTPSEKFDLLLRSAANGDGVKRTHKDMVK